jgi:hypothetical protein
MSPVSSKADAATTAGGGTQAGRTGPARRWQDRVEATDWDAVRSDLDAYGCSQWMSR